MVISKSAGENKLTEELGTDSARTIMNDPHPVLVVGPDGRRPIFAHDEAARKLGFETAAALIAAGLPDSAPGVQRFRTLIDAGTADPTLERLRFFVGLRGVMLLAFCRRVVSRAGSAHLVVVFTQPHQADDRAQNVLPPTTLISAPASPAPKEEAPHGACQSLPMAEHSDAGPGVVPAWVHDRASARAARRFVFTLDAAGQVLEVSPPLRDVVGTRSAAIEGYRLADIVRRYDELAARHVLNAIADGETFTGVRINWPVDGIAMTVPVELSALPLIEQVTGLKGFSGFGRCRIDEAKIPPEAFDQPAIAALGEHALPVGADSDEADGSTNEVQAAHLGEAIDLTIETSVSDQLSEPDANLSTRQDDTAQLSEAHPESVAAEGQNAGLQVDNASFVDDELVDVADDPASARETAPSPILPAEPAAVRPVEPVSDPAKVVSIHTGQPTTRLPGFERQGLSTSERNAFRDIAKALGARFDEDDSSADESPITREPPPQLAARAAAEPAEKSDFASPSTLVQAGTQAATDLLDQLPGSLLVLRGDTALFANRALLDMTGYPDRMTFLAEDGARAIFRKSTMPNADRLGLDTIILTSREGEMMPVEAHLQRIDWQGTQATLLSLRRAVELEQGKALRSVAVDLKRARADIAELRAILDTATDGVVILDEKGQVLGLNGAAQALFGVQENEVVGENITELLHRDSHAEALDYLEGLGSTGVRSVLNDGREISGREKKGGRIPLFMTLGRISEEEPKRFCAVLRDMTAWKRAEAGLTEARQVAEMANAKKSDFLAKISHEIRTPMNAIIGFADLMQEERLGALGNPKYKEYLGDIRTSGQHVVSLVNDLLDLAKIEAGRMELAFAATDLNAIITSTVAIIQPQANQNRVLVRTQLATSLPAVVADERSIRQIVLNMLSNATRFTEAGGQVIVSTSLQGSGEVAIRIRDTGIGMTAHEIEQALEPFRQVGRDRSRGGTGLGLPLTKALVEANRANFSISSKPGEGTLVEITFPVTRVLAE
ncbi:PAS domain [Rhabdaerophilaceae bacterium]